MKLESRRISSSILTNIFFGKRLNLVFYLD